MQSGGTIPAAQAIFLAIAARWRVEPGLTVSGERRELSDETIAAVRRILISAAARQVPTAVIGNVIVALCVTGALWHSVPREPLLLWLCLMAGAGAMRLSIGLDVVSADSAIPDMSRKMNRLAWLGGAMGLLWGLPGAVLVPSGDMELRAFTSCVVVAMTAAAVASNIALPLAGALFISGALVPIGVSFLFSPVSPVNGALALLSFFFLGVLLVFLRASSATLSEAVVARSHNEYLKAEVDKACLALAEAVEVAREASQSKSRFLANMSHEIRTPMNAVLGLATTLLDETLAPEHRESVGAIRDSADVLLRLINEILDMSQIEAGRITLENAPFSPSKVIQDTINIVSARAAAKGLMVDMNWDDTIPEGLCGDVHRIRQVLLNLVANAVKFTETGGIVIAARRIGAAGQYVTTEWSVRDTGIGISAAGLASLFQEFRQADASISRRFGGSGLGLSISRRLVEMMGGTILAHSEPGDGSVFSFQVTLPIASVPTEATRDDTSEAALRAALRSIGPKPRVLLVEDNPINQLVARQFLKHFDVQVDVANNGLEAVEAACRVSYDLIYMDMHMPEMDGLEATRAIRQRPSRDRRVPIVAFTASAFEEDELACRAAGMDDFISKPVRKSVFVDVTLRALTRQGELVDVE